MNVLLCENDVIKIHVGNIIFIWCPDCVIVRDSDKTFINLIDHSIVARVSKSVDKEMESFHDYKNICKIIYKGIILIKEKDKFILYHENKVYILICHIEPEEAIYRGTDEKEFEAIILNKNANMVSEDMMKNKIVILDEGSDFTIGDERVTMRRDELVVKGKIYKEGDSVTINGRKVLIGRTDKM